MSENASLYHLSDALTRAVEGGYTVDEETGEVLWSPDDIEQLQLSIQEKAEACAVVCKSKRAMSKALREEAKSLLERADAEEKAAKKLEDYMAMCAHLRGGVIETIRCKLSFRRATRVDIVDAGKVPREYIHVQTTERVDKIAVKNALKAGEEVPGCALVETQHLQVR